MINLNRILASLSCWVAFVGCGAHDSGRLAPKGSAHSSTSALTGKKTSEETLISGTGVNNGILPPRHTIENCHGKDRADGDMSLIIIDSELGSDIIGSLRVNNAWTVLICIKSESANEGDPTEVGAKALWTCVDQSPTTNSGLSVQLYSHGDKGVLDGDVMKTFAAGVRAEAVGTLSCDK